MRKIAVLLTFALLITLIPTTLAGGWATVTLDDAPGDIRAGEPWTVGFTVLQHGNRPVHNLGKDLPIVPKLTATNAATGERVEVIAEPTEELGHFAAVVTFPVEGEWEWAIAPNPFPDETQFEPLTVIPAAPSVSRLAADWMAHLSLSQGLGWGLVVALAAVALLVVRYRRREPARSAAK